MNSSFTVLDGVVLLAYLVGTTLLGVWLGRSQRDSRDYFVAGQAVPWWAVLFSVVATETSALTFISIPGLAYATDLTFLQVAAGYLLGRIVIAFTLLPKYYDGKLVTAYALLEQRFGTATRRLASVTFMFTRALGDSVRIFATTIPLVLILGSLVPEQYLRPVSVLVLGAFTLVYTYYGGMRAVIWTDVVQTGVYLLGGIAAIYLIGNGVDGGWSTVFANAGDADKLRVFDPSLGFDRPHTLAAGLIGGAFLSMASHGADQMIVQRLLAASSLRDARIALIGSGVGVILQFGLFLVIGVGLHAFYSGAEFASPDHIFPRFIIEEMPPGLTGIVIAALLAAAMSTVSSSLNSLSAASTHDIYLPLRKKKRLDGAGELRVGRIFTVLWAFILLGGALMYRTQGTPVVVVALSIASFTYGGLLGGFFLGLFWKRAAQRDAILGMSVGITAMILVVFAARLSTALPSVFGGLAPLGGIAWPWYVLIGTTITMTVGIVSSFTHGPPEVSVAPAREVAA
jgi:SSS family transporter